MENTVWVVYNPGPYARRPECFAMPVHAVAFTRLSNCLGTRRMVEDRVTFYRFADEHAARADAWKRFVESQAWRELHCDHYCNEPLRCPSCNRRFWAWAEQHTNGKGSRRSRKNVSVSGFYDHVNVIAPPCGA